MESGLINFYQHLPEHLNSVAFKLGFFSLDWYSLMYLVGFAVVYFLLKWRIKHNEFKISNSKSQDLVFDLLLYLFIGLLIGARLGYVVFYNLPYYLNHPLEAFLPVQITNYGLLVTGYYGMSYYGGLIGAILAGWMFAKKNKIHPVKSGEAGARPVESRREAGLIQQGKQFNGVNFWALADFAVPAIPAGYFFGRIGNFLNGELYGRVTEKAWGMYFPADPFGLLRHPSQLYEAFFEGLILFLILWLIRNKLRVAGDGLCAYLFGYGFLRFFIEFFREPDPLRLGSLAEASAQVSLIFGFLTLGQLFSLGLCAVSLALFCVIMKNKGKTQS